MLAAVSFVKGVAGYLWPYGGANSDNNTTPEASSDTPVVPEAPSQSQAIQEISRDIPSSSQQATSNTAAAHDVAAIAASHIETWPKSNSSIPKPKPQSK